MTTSQSPSAKEKVIEKVRGAVYPEAELDVVLGWMIPNESGGMIPLMMSLQDLLLALPPDYAIAANGMMMVFHKDAGIYNLYRDTKCKYDMTKDLHNQPEELFIFLDSILP